MSIGNSPGDDAAGKMQFDRLMAKAEADRAARLAGHKSLFRRLLERLRPHRQDPNRTYGTRIKLTTDLAYTRARRLSETATVDVSLGNSLSAIPAYVL